MKRLIAALALLLPFTAPAQTLKWGVSAGATGWATDGQGALAIIHRTEGPIQLGVVTWVDQAGRSLFTNVIADLGGNLSGSSIQVVRFNARELAVQVQASYEYAPGTNYLRRFKKDGTFTDIVLPVGESMDAIPSTLADDRGFFTREPAPGGGIFIFRRYSN